MVQISVIVPFYNRVNSLPRAIQSILNQTAIEFEIICVDDGSTDLSAEFIIQICDPRIQLVQHNRNKGAAAARNTGVSIAKGQWIAFLDSDDEWHPDKLAIQFADIIAHSADIGFTDCMFEKSAARYPYRHQYPKYQKGWFTHFLDGCYVNPGATMMLRRDIWLSIGGLDENLLRLEDWDFLLRASLMGACFHHTPQILATVYIAQGWPSPAIIKNACTQIIMKHKQTLCNKAGVSGFCTLKASAFLEISVAYIRNKNFFIGIIFLLRVLISPKRFARFIRKKIN